MNHSEDILFSIIIPTYNRADIIGKSIESVISQKYPNWELIIVDDGSTDNTQERVNSYNDSRIRYFYKKNEERSIARNFGVDKANGDYISFLDDDDYYLPYFLTEFSKVIKVEGNQVALFMCNEYVEDENGEQIENSIPFLLLDNPVRLLWEIQTSIRPFVIHREILEKKRFKEWCKWGEDFHLAIRIVLKYPLNYIPISLSVNVKHSSQGTNTKFINNYRENAELSIMCINDLLKDNLEELNDKIPRNIIYDLINHKVYGFASAAMKQCDYFYLFKMIKILNSKGSSLKTLYYYVSLIGRIPFFVVKCIFKMLNKKNTKIFLI